MATDPKASEKIINTVVGFLSNQYLSQIWNLFENYFHDPITLEQVVSKIDMLNDKLDIFKNAPYQAAYTYFREGNLEKFRDKLIDTMSIDKFNLAAQLLYIKLLLSEGRHQIAFEQYWNIMDKFGCLKEIVPEILINEYKKQNFKNLHFTEAPIILIPGSHDCIFKKFHITEAWASRNIFIAKWMKPKSSWFFFSKNHFDRYVITVANAHKQCILYLKDTENEIVAVTNHYIALKTYDGLKLYGYNGNPIDITQEQINYLFGKTEPYNKFTNLSACEKHIGDLKLKLGTIDDEEERYVHTIGSGTDESYTIYFKMETLEVTS